MLRPDMPVEEVPEMPGDDVFRARYLGPNRPVVVRSIVPPAHPAHQWTIDHLTSRVGDNEVFVRKHTRRRSYKLGEKYAIESMRMSTYLHRIATNDPEAGNYYLAVQNIKNTFPQLIDECPLPPLIRAHKLHHGPYLWVAPAGHFEYAHIDADEGFLILLKGHKQVRIWAPSDFEKMYPRALGAQGRTVQCDVATADPHDDILARFPLFADAQAYVCDLTPGDALYIPTFWWHQVTSTEVSVSVNVFWGERGETAFLEKVLPNDTNPTLWTVFRHFLLNVIEQNRSFPNFPRVLLHLKQSLKQFVQSQTREIASEEQLHLILTTVVEYLRATYNPQSDSFSRESISYETHTSKNAPNLKIRGLLQRNDKKESRRTGQRQPE